jgi:hypothetical protein
MIRIPGGLFKDIGFSFFLPASKSSAKSSITLSGTRRESIREMLANGEWLVYQAGPQAPLDAKSAFTSDQHWAVLQS